MPGFADFAGFAGVVEVTRLNTSEFLYYLDELYGNELVFAFSFVSSNSTDVETTEQFILLHRRYVCDFSGLLTSPRNSETRRKHLYRTLFTSSVFLLLTHDEFFDALQGKKFRLNLRLFAYFKGYLSDSLSGKVVSLTACLLVDF